MTELQEAQLHWACLRKQSEENKPFGFVLDNRVVSVYSADGNNNVKNREMAMERFPDLTIIN